MIKIVLFIFIITNAVFGNDQICKKIYLDKYIQMKNIPLNIKLFENKKIFMVLPESMFFKKNYGMSKLEYNKIVDLHYYLNEKVE